MVTIFSGIPGSGKSTLVKAGNFDFVVSADDYFMVDGIYQFDRAKLGEAHGRCLREFVRLMNFSDAVAVDNTNTTVVEIAPYAALALAYGHGLQIVTVECDPAVGAARNTHGVDLRTCQRMVENLKYRKLPSYWPNKVIKAEGV